MKHEGQPIALPEFPPQTEWINADFVRVGTLFGQHAILVWFWDYTSLNSLRTLPYLTEWDSRYRDKGLRVIGVHSPQFEFGGERVNVERAVERLGIEFPVAHDPDFAIWKFYGAEVWPSLYLWDRTGTLRHFHFAEGAYDETERAIGKLLREIDPQVELPQPMEPIRETDRPDAKVIPPTPHQYMNEHRFPRAVEAGHELSIRYAGAGAAAVLDGHGRVDLVVDGEPVRTIDLDGPRLYEFVSGESHEEHEISLRFRNEALVYVFSFAPAPA
ncbi:MAG: redoxin domain-containing protein [Solirubrobacterales bacterium]